MRIENREKGYESIVDVYLDTDGSLILDMWTGGPRQRLAEYREQHGARTRLLASIERGVSRQDVEARERAMAADLRRRGYKVRQG